MENRTVITIAHRLMTIIDFDLILVLEDGELVEFDSPANLLAKEPVGDPTAFFLRMVNETGDGRKALKKIANSASK